MARLTIEQIKAPDLSVASQATARAGESFREGMTSASDLLSQYQSGLEAKGDAELTNLLAGARNEDEWNNILATTDFSRMNISTEMRNNIMNRRDSILGYENQRADTRLVDANTGNVNATAARTLNQIDLDNRHDARLQGDYVWEDTRRRELAGLVGTVLDSERDGRTNGYQSGSDSQGEYAAPVGDIMNSRFQSSMGVDRDTADVLSRAFLMNFQDESGMRGDITEAAPNVHGTRGRGYYQLTGDRREAFEARYGANGYTDENQVEWLIHEIGGPESRAGRLILEAAASGDVGVTAAAIVTHFLRPAAEYRDSRVERYLSGNGNEEFNARITENPNQGGSSRDRLYSELSATTALDPATALAITQNDYNFAQNGQNEIVAENERIGREIRDQALVDGINNPENFRSGQLVEEVFNNPNLSATEKLAAIEAARSTEETAGTLYSPNAPVNPVLDAVTQTQMDTDRRNFNNSPANQFIADADSYSSDPVASLQAKLDLTNDPQALPEETTNNLLRYIDGIVANNPNVSRGEVVAAMERSFIRDPGDDDNSSFWYNSDMTLNTIERRFPRGKITELLDQFAGPEARNRYDTEQIGILSSTTGIESSLQERNELLSQAQKYPEGSLEREQLEQEAMRLETLLFSGNSESTVTRKLREYVEATPSISERLSGIDPNSVEYDRALADVETSIQADDSLSSIDKRLLIAALRG